MSKFTWFILALVALVAGIILYNKVLNPKDQSPKGPAAGPPKELAVTGFVVQPTNIQNSIVATGTLLASEEIDLHAEISGKIVSLRLEEGKAVGQGALLVKLYDEDLQAQLKKLLLQKETAGKTESRLKQLLAINGVGAQEYDNAQIQLNNIIADIELLQTQIAKTEIRAPFRGVVGLKNVSVGAYVTPASVLASLRQIDPLKIDFAIPEKYIGAVKVGTPVHFSIDGADEKFNAKVYAIESKIDEATRTVRVRALVRNNKAALYPGAFAKIDLGLAEQEGALMVPTQCIIPEARNKKVIAVKGGKAKFLVVQTGVRNESYIQLKEGVEVGDTIVATALMYVKPDIDIKVVKLIK